MSPLHAIASALLAAAAAFAPPDPPAFEVTLKTNVLARGLEVTIGDLADVAPAGADSLAIGSLRFGPAPVPGFTRTVTRTELLQALVAAGHAADSFRLKGATETVVQAVTVDVTPDELTEAASTVLQAVLAQEGGDVEWEVAARVRNVLAPAGRKTRELRARVRGAATHPSSAVVDVEVLVDGEPARTVPVQFKLTRFHAVLKTRGTVREGTPLGPDNLELAREKVAQASGLFLASFEQVAGLVARRNLQAGRMLMLADVGAPALIRQGELVTVVLTRGRVKVTARAVANHDAALGERITLTNPRTRAQIDGLVAAPGTVVVPVAD
jgi:flagella basal body P-ring formation protein FlgA